MEDSDINEVIAAVIDQVKENINPDFVPPPVHPLAVNIQAPSTALPTATQAPSASTASTAVQDTEDIETWRKNCRKRLPH